MAQKKKVDYQKNLSYPQALNMIKKQQERIEVLEWEVNNEWCFNLRQFFDCSVIALHDTFGFGQYRNKKFVESMQNQIVKYMNMCVKEVRETEQGKNCDDFWVTQSKMDKEVRSALGKDVPDWEERYSDKELEKLLKSCKRWNSYGT